MSSSWFRGKPPETRITTLGMGVFLYIQTPTSSHSSNP